ncbi:MAG: hypothetical protein J6B98_06945 [Bacilli bacterium]|nr:hypothetical protein [Bacilli bacterium]
MNKLAYKMFVIITICFLFSEIFLVKAEEVTIKATITGNGVNLRSDHRVVSGNIIKELSLGTVVEIKDTTLFEGSGCSAGWKKIKVGNDIGYVCSSYVKESNGADVYGRPWTSPKKAIEGGALFISKSYISKGQFTSYLKKFNVNPNGHYAVYNHQYMANLRAPMSEASSTYNSISKNNLLNNSINFVIPQFDNMPESTYDANIKDTGRGTADIQDEAFEASIAGFNETYKPYLRYLHTKYPNWTFTVMNTGLDFEASYLSEKAVSSIEISSGMCEQNPYYQTEKGWCIGNEAATKFFLDPRNFLSERYIFMFENLSFSELYNEAAVQSVLNGTFMQDISVLDNQSYASIFVEAGRKANVSPIYLASLARQESGSNGSRATTGDAFTYDGINYSGLFNFFNIGAYSSASSPILAGLVWASGGTNGDEVDDAPTNENNNTNNNVNYNYTEILEVKTNGTFISGFGLGTNIDVIINKIGDKGTVVIYDANGTGKKSGSKIATGDTIKITNNGKVEEYKYVMYGDLSGDGEINSADLLKMRQHLLGTSKLNNSFLESAYLSGDKEINSADLLRLRQHLLGTNKIVQ